MENITVKDIVEMTGGVLLCGDENTAVKDVCINSKEIKEGDLFVPIIGENVDAHRFIESALEKGAASLTSEHDGVVVAEKPYIRVDNTQVALQRIGAGIRTRLIDIPIVAVTGSVGKTTTRTMIAHALSAGKKTYQTEKNFNSQIGVPITLSRMNSDDEIAVLELGISEDGQMDILSEMVRPDIAVVTTIGVAHIQFMKTRENIRKQGREGSDVRAREINHRERGECAAKQAPLSPCGLVSRTRGGADLQDINQLYYALFQNV